MKERLIALVMFLGLLPCVSAGAVEQPTPSPTKVVLLLEASIEGPYVKVGDIAEVSEPEDVNTRFRAEAVRRLIIERPEEFPVFFSADAVKMRLAREGIEAEISGAKYCRVVQISSGDDTVSRTATDALTVRLEKAARFGMDNVDEDTVLSLSVVNIFGDDGKVPPGEVKKMNIEGTGGGRDTRWVRFTGRDAWGKRVWGWARFDIRLKRHVVVVAKGLSRGHFITAADVMLKEKELKPGEKVGFGTLAEVVGRHALRPISVGEVLRPSDVERPVLVPRGRDVNVIVDGAGFCLSDRVVARDDGALGEMIRVQNPRSGEVYRARVVSADTVEAVGCRN